MADENNETLKMIKEFLSLDCESGRLTWKKREVSSFVKKGRTSAEGLCFAWNSRFAGKDAFTSKLQSSGTYRGRIGGNDFMKGRVVFAIANDRWPEGFIVHADGDTENFKPENLIEINCSEKTAMSKTRGGKDTGFRGVYYRTHNGNKKRPCGKYWDVYFLGKFYGSYEYPIQAAIAYDKLAIEHFGENCVTNITRSKETQ